MKQIKKILAAGLACSILTVALATTAFASSYSSTLYFNTTLNGATRYYDGQNIGLSMTVNNQWTNASFTAQLWRQHWWGSDFVGHANYFAGWNDHRWSNVGAGDYNFYFQKNNTDNSAAHDAWFRSENVYMYNY